MTPREKPMPRTPDPLARRRLIGLVLVVFAFLAEVWFPRHSSGYYGGLFVFLFGFRLMAYGSASLALPFFVYPIAFMLMEHRLLAGLEWLYFLPAIIAWAFAYARQRRAG